MDINVFDAKRFRISEFKNWANRLCPEIKATEKRQSFICAPAQAVRSKQPVIEECDTGMLKLVVPIFANGEDVGALGACGFLLDDDEVDRFLVHKTAAISEGQVARLAEGIPAITAGEVKLLVQYIANQIAGIVANCGMRP